jgi:hypothetical protein
MSGIRRPKGVMICCSVLQAEVASLREVHWPDHKLIFLPSMMHMHPERLASSLESVLDAELKQGYGVVLIYGDCCARMTALEALPGVVRTRGNNCCDLLLGREEYRRLSHEGVFFLIPEWARRWREIFTKELGLDRTNAVSFMRDMHRRLVYLDTGIVPVPEKELRECAEYCGLPYEARPVSLGLLRSAIEEALLRCKTTGAQYETGCNR